MTHPILQPFVMLMILTATVWVFMFIQRNRYILSNKINPQRISSPELVSQLLPETINRPSNNLKNLFELPIIFYAICIALVAAQNTDTSFVQLAWAYVALRAVHSIIHCTFNRVILRFIPYALSSLVLWAMVIKFAILVF
jgi:hypothetical protein